MCGIVGVVQQGPVDRAALTRSRDVIRHRGPDDEGLYISPNGRVGLGFRRLSIIDLSASGHQPMSNEDGTVWIVYNGEIYNHVSLREELEAHGHTFRSRADTEVLVHGYEQWGKGVVERLRGMFAFAVYDSRVDTLFIARDRLGIKPLFYQWNGGTFLFASELKAILAFPGVRPDIEPRALYDYLTYRYVPAPLTAYRNVYKLPAAHTATISNGSLNLQRYWDLNLCDSLDVDETVAVPRVRDAMVDAIRSHMISDVPVGVLLSGGLDSSSIGLVAASSQSSPLHTFSIGFDEAGHNELPYARVIAERMQSHHHERVVSSSALLDDLDLVVSTYDEPFADTSAVPTIQVSRLARENVKVVLSGEGGDEAFAGYTWHRQMRTIGRLSERLPLAVRRAAAGAAGLWPQSVRGAARASAIRRLAVGPVEQYADLLEWITPEERRKIVPDGVIGHGHDDYWHYREHWRSGVDLVTAVQYLDLKTYLADQLLPKLDRASMSVSLEGRVPFLDHPLIELMFKLPAGLRLKNGRTKYLQREAMRSVLPRETIERRKVGFVPPITRAIGRADATRFDQMLNDGEAVRCGFLRKGAIQQLTAHQWSAKVWMLLVLEAWARRYTTELMHTAQDAVT